MDMTQSLTAPNSAQLPERDASNSLKLLRTLANIAVRQFK